MTKTEKSEKTEYKRLKIYLKKDISDEVLQKQVFFLVDSFIFKIKCKITLFNFENLKMKEFEGLNKKTASFPKLFSLKINRW